jgi:hypothetical protein
MTDREKLIALVTAALCNQSAEEVADHLLANGVVVREKGEWVFEEVYPGVVSLNGYLCSKCRKNTAKKTDFCPNCGADMRKGENDG